MPGQYKQYLDKQTEDIKACLRDLGCQPILFMGAGMSKRYTGGPSWRELLEIAARDNPLIEYDLAYYLQSFETLAEVGQQFVDPYHKWAWGKGRAKFSDELFSPTVAKDNYLKDYVAKYVAKGMPKSLEAIKGARKDEITDLQNIRPNSIITTNYDTLCETLFPDYEPIVGQKIIRSPWGMIGEIYKIHGCVSAPSDMVLTEGDYKDWNSRKKYLSAKLLAYFLEHPVVIMGYGIQDENVTAILRDIDEILSASGALVPNIYYVIYDEKITEDSSPPTEVILDLKNGSSMRVKCIHAREFSWIFQAFAASEGLENVNPKILRALMSRTYDIVRHDIPKMTIEVDYNTLEQVVSKGDALPKLLGLTTISDPENFNAAYPYTLTGVAQKLGYTSWHGANQLLAEIKSEKNVDVKSSDNQYHITVRSGTNSFVNKYSESLMELLERVRLRKEYSVSLKKKKGK